MNRILELLAQDIVNDKLTKFEIGDTIRVDYRIIEGSKERVQPFEGVVIAFHRGYGNTNATFALRREAKGYVVERRFLLYSPKISGIKVLKKAKIRRAKLYYLRNLRGKMARLNEKIN